MGKLADALKLKFRTPHEALRALGLDDALIEEEKTMPQPKKTRLGAYLLGALSPFFKGSPPKEAMLALDTAVGTVTAATFSADKPKIVAAIKDVQSRHARNADAAGMTKFLDGLDPAMAVDEGTAEEDKPAATGTGEAHDETDEEKAARLKKLQEEKEAKDAAEEQKAFQESDEYKQAKDAWTRQKGRGAHDQPPPFNGQPKPGGEMVEKKAMDEAIKNATLNIVKTQRAIRAAEKEVMPWVGTLHADFESPTQVYKMALDSLKIDVKDIPEQAYPHILRAQPLPSSPARRVQLAQDSSKATGFFGRFPNAKRISLM